jgi:iron complex outermembrane receptor protein
VFRNNGILTASVVDNAAKATVKGAELEVQYVPVDWLKLSLGAGYTDYEYDSYLDSGVDVSDTKIFPVAPEFTGSLSADVRLAQGTWGKLHALVDFTHSDDYYVQAFDVRPLSTTVRQSAQTTRAEALDLLNLTLRLADIEAGDTRMDVMVWTRNALDTHRRTGGVDFGPLFGNLITSYYNEPRTYGIDVSFKF